MIKINCPNCRKEITINIAKAVDEFGEEFICPNCKYRFRYAANR